MTIVNKENSKIIKFLKRKIFKILFALRCIKRMKSFILLF